MPDATKRDWTPIIWVIGLIFICGMTYQSVDSLGGRVVTNTSDIKSNTQAIHSNALLVAGLKSTLDATKEDTTEIKREFGELKNYLMQYDFDKRKD